MVKSTAGSPTPKEALLPEQLRERAEALVGHGGQADAAGAHAVDPTSLIHDLRVHQAELEIQNEELRSSQARLSEANAELDRLYNEAPVGYLSLDSGAMILKANRTFLTMVGAGDALRRGQAFLDFVAPEERDGFLARYNAIFRHPEGKSAELRLSSGIDVLLTTRYDESSQSLRVTLMDVTERKAQSDRVAGLLQEKNLILREVHHRIKNNLGSIDSLLALEADMLGPGPASAALSAARARIRSQISVYELLYRSDQFLNLSAKGYFERALEQLRIQHGGSGIDIEGRFDDVQLDSSVIMPLGILLNELVSNTFKYAFPDGRKGRVLVEFRVEPGPEGLLRVSDNGVGFPPGFSPDKDGGFGFVLVRGLTGQVEGRMEIVGSRGAVVELRFPIHRQEG